MRVMFFFFFCFFRVIISIWCCWFFFFFSQNDVSVPFFFPLGWISFHLLLFVDGVSSSFVFNLFFLVDCVKRLCCWILCNYSKEFLLVLVFFIFLVKVVGNLYTRNAHPLFQQARRVHSRVNHKKLQSGCVYIYRSVSLLLWFSLFFV